MALGRSSAVVHDQEERHIPPGIKQEPESGRRIPLKRDSISASAPLRDAGLLQARNDQGKIEFNTETSLRENPRRGISNTKEFAQGMELLGPAQQAQALTSALYGSHVARDITNAAAQLGDLCDPKHLGENLAAARRLANEINVRQKLTAEPVTVETIYTAAALLQERAPAGSVGSEWAVKSMKDSIATQRRNFEQGIKHVTSKEIPVASHREVAPALIEAGFGAREIEIGRHAHRREIRAKVAEYVPLGFLAGDDASYKERELQKDARARHKSELRGEPASEPLNAKQIEAAQHAYRTRQVPLSLPEQAAAEAQFTEQTKADANRVRISRDSWKLAMQIGDIKPNEVAAQMPPLYRVGFEEEAAGARTLTRRSPPTFIEDARANLDSRLREDNFNKEGLDRRLSVLHTTSAVLKDVLKGYAEGKVSANELKEFDNHLTYTLRDYNVPRSTWFNRSEVVREIETLKSLREIARHYASGDVKPMSEEQSAKAVKNIDALCVMFNVKEQDPANPLKTSDGRTIERLKGNLRTEGIQDARNLALESSMELIKRGELTPERQRTMNALLAHIQNWNN